MNYLGNYSCTSSICEPGETRCAGNSIEECMGDNVWEVQSNAPENAFCSVRNHQAEYICNLGFAMENGICKAMCEEGCSEDRSKSITCPEPGMMVIMWCKNGCDSQTMKCIEGK